MLRTLALTLVMLISFGAMLPLATSLAHGLRQTSASKPTKVRRYSRAWWRRYRARMKRKREAAMAHRRAVLAQVSPQLNLSGQTFVTTLPKLPSGWKNLATAGNTELRFRTETDAADIPGQASLSVVAQSRPAPAYLTAREQRRMLSGVDIGDLRRIVIDKMLATNGWVTNDYIREVEGYRVFIVTAQTPEDGRSPDRIWNFYFTEVNGRIYSLATTSSFQSADRLAQEAERFIVGLHLNSEPKQQKLNR